MSTEAVQNISLEKHINKQRNGVFLPDYPPCNGNPGSSSNNWVPEHYLGYLIDKTFREMQNLKKKN